MYKLCTKGSNFSLNNKVYEYNIMIPMCMDLVALGGGSTYEVYKDMPIKLMDHFFSPRQSYDWV